MKILVLGAGIAGMTTAYYLEKLGYEVTVVDKASGPAMDTSFANGGQLSYSHSEPWANPGALKKILKWSLQKEAPLKFSFRAERAMWQWGMGFLRNCTPGRARFNSENILRLALYSRDVLHEITRANKFDFDYQKKGILHFFKDEKTLAENRAHAEFQKQFGCPYQELTAKECIQKEPALKPIAAQIVGGIFFPYDESGDIHTFCVELGKRLEKKGVKFRYNTTIKRLLCDGNIVTGVDTDKGSMLADIYVMCLGAYSSVFLRQTGRKIPIYPMKGYSISMPLLKPAKAPVVSLTDQSEKVVFSRLGNRLRVAGTAEFAGYDHSLNPSRIEGLKRLTESIFPGVADFSQTFEWACLRPSTPSGAPLLGKAGANLMLNTGHGTLGWTLGPGSSKIIATMIDGQTPEIDMTGLGV